MSNLNDVYISREQAIDAIEREFEDDIMGATKATEAVYSVDLADVSMNVCGYWKIEKVKGLHYTENVCSICGAEYRCGYEETLDFEFCPYCGAKMDESEDDNAADGTANTGR